MNDLNGAEIKEGHNVHCWDGDKQQKHITASLRGVVNIRKTESGSDRWCVDDNELALGCAEYVEVI